MSSENIAKLRTALENEADLPSVRFNMHHWNTDRGCGTIACMGGMTEHLRQKEDPDFDASNSWHRSEDAIEWLGLEQDIGHALFHPYPIAEYDWDMISRPQALEALDLAANGASVDQLRDHWKKVARADDMRLDEED